MSLQENFNLLLMFITVTAVATYIIDRFNVDNKVCYIEVNGLSAFVSNCEITEELAKVIKELKPVFHKF
ncbi:triple gene block protein 4 [Musa ornata-associated banmivirus]|uniref:triple gene block protein 4 n=1 Tax=Musa ornata-associated banmivirus TaxID=3071210 RepID=UPI002481C5B5|nr:triple gene block protein 4 [Musa ornata-associated banmivirus]UIK24039.1 triple gene block protein 4 [Musa ornata-associated banmivirus]